MALPAKSAPPGLGTKHVHYTTPAAGGGCGGVLHLPVAVAARPGAPILLYTRASGTSGGDTLSEKVLAASEKVYELAGEYPCEPYGGVEPGHFLHPRPALALAAERALVCGAILVAPTLNRFVRWRESYKVDYRTQRLRWYLVPPSEDDFRALRQLTGDVILATLLHPTASESDQQSYLTTLTGKAGRPRGRRVGRKR